MPGECGSCAKVSSRQFDRLDVSVEDIEFIVRYQLLRIWFEIIKLKRAIITLETQLFGIGPLHLEIHELPLSLKIIRRSA